MCGHYLFPRSDNDLFPIVDGYKVGFMRWASLEHMDLVFISCCIYIMFLFQEHLCYFVPKYGILFTSGFERLIMWWWFEYSCLWWSSHKLHVLEEVFNFICYKTCTWWRWCCRGYLIWFDQYYFFIFYHFFFFFVSLLDIQLLDFLNIVFHIFIAFSFVLIEFISQHSLDLECSVVHVALN